MFGGEKSLSLFLFCFVEAPPFEKAIHCLQCLLYSVHWLSEEYCSSVCSGWWLLSFWRSPWRLCFLDVCSVLCVFLFVYTLTERTIFNPYSPTSVLAKHIPDWSQSRLLPTSTVVPSISQGLGWFRATDLANTFSTHAARMNPEEMRAHIWIYQVWESLLICASSKYTLFGQ